MILTRLLSVIFLTALLFSCGQSQPPPKRVAKPPIDESAGEEKYKTSDRGFGTLDYSKETREDMNSRSKQSEQAAEDTNQ